MTKDLTRWLRVALCGLLFSGALATGAVTVRRVLNSSTPSGTGFALELNVTMGNPAPAGLIICEELPTNWTVTDTLWQRSDGQPSVSPSVSTRGCEWLFDPLGTPPSDGVLTLLIAEPAMADVTPELLSGHARWYESGQEQQAETTGGNQTFVISLEAGWNLISLPIEPDTPNVQAVLAGTPCIGAVWGWDPVRRAYLAAGNLHAGEGYWVFMTEACSLAVTGAATENPGVTLARGWNLVGVSEPTPLAGLPLLGPGWYWKRGAYQVLPQEDNLVPGVGYWLRAP